MIHERVLRQIPMVHVYPQSYQHQDAEIIGNRAGLERLRDAIDRALATGIDEAEVFAKDGEGYGIKVMELCDALMDEMPTAYTDDLAGETYRLPWPEMVSEFVMNWGQRRVASLKGGKDCAD